MTFLFPIAATKNTDSETLEALANITVLCFSFFSRIRRVFEMREIEIFENHSLGLSCSITSNSDRLLRGWDLQIISDFPEIFW
jgi:hypothetical protein